mmetsp:Transcript_41692/g.50762  ORF Transcript_41692/g.50762 Transcript_41692/m.50762 type:complete len:337 (+) Transcript_41692:38-1048(+)
MIPMHAKTTNGDVHQLDLQCQQLDLQQTLTSRRRSLLVVLSCAVFLAISSYYGTSARPLHRNLSYDKLESHTSKYQTGGDGDSSRPVMNTFFSLRSRTGEYLPTPKDMQIDPLRQWEQAWQDAGWDTRILTLEDARNHPDFEYYTTILSAIHFREGSYNFMCFVRWLAMATSKQDGFMSDYDTFPLGGMEVDFGYNLPNDGKFTSYQRHVPALLSGTASEWERVAKRVLNVAVEHGNDRFYSDMFALRDLYYEDPSSYIQESRLAAYPYSKKDVVNCDIARKSLGAHLSHSQTKRNARAGLISSGTSRGRHGLLLMDQVQEQCYSESSGTECKRCY